MEVWRTYGAWLRVEVLVVLVTMVEKFTMQRVQCEVTRQDEGVWGGGGWGGGGVEGGKRGNNDMII